ncbi:hypothetical protein PoB_007311500 [Plakobranchus ocellatus]|uniref:CCHC-type domain-containing protein n=1 Tax=Plakobranchus ocellatus TaxID=259542 RepID=A0AAV4DRP8_9GAST|nr:hypothetical protein PoB_007311500 [Plakobranchus ocellatus]
MLPFHGKKHAQKKPLRSYTPTDERREAPPAPQYDEEYSAEFQEDQHRGRFREYQSSGQLHNRNSRRQLGGTSPPLSTIRFRRRCSSRSVEARHQTDGVNTSAQAAKLRPESLDEATSYILQYQFNHTVVYGRKEDRSPEAAVRSVRSRRDYSEERSPPRREYRGRDATPVKKGLRGLGTPKKVGESYSLRQDRPPFKPPQERREVTPPGRSREAEPDQPELKDLLGSMTAGLESRLGRMLDDQLNNFTSRIEGKVSSLSLKVEKMEDRIDKFEKSRRSPSPKTRSTTCYGCGNSGHFISQCPERGIKSVRFEDPKNRTGSD